MIAVRMRRATCAGVVVLAIGPWTAIATSAAEPTPTVAPVRVEASAEPRDVTIGEPVRYVVEVTTAPDTEVRIPVLAGSIGNFTIVDFGELEPRRDGGATTVGRWYSLTTFDTGDFLIPAPAVDYRRPGEPMITLTGNEVLVGVESLLAADPDATDIRDIKPPEEIPFDWTPYLILAGMILVALLLVGALLAWWRRPRRARSVPRRAAHDVAFEELERLRALGLVDAGKIPDFYVGLTRIVRSYLEDGLHLRAPEMTTEEFLAAAGEDPRLTAQQRRLLGEFLSQADLVKFARFVPTPRDCDAAFAAARRFVEETRPGGGSSVEGGGRAAA